MPIEAVKIPQNVNVEDRIVGPITLRQLIVLMITGGISYAIWTGVKSATGYSSLPLTILCWTPALIGAAFAFVKIQNIDLLRFCLLMIERAQKPTTRVWEPRRGISINFQFSTGSMNVDKTPSQKVQPHHERIEELSALLDRGVVSTDTETPAPVVEDSDAPMVESTHPVNAAKIHASQTKAPVLDDFGPRQLTKSEPPIADQKHSLIQDLFFPPSHA